MTGSARRGAWKKISYSNAIELLRLADLAAARHSGVTLGEIVEEFGVSERTAQRMVRALTEAFPHAVDVLDGEDRRRRWLMREVPVARLSLGGADELEALEVGIGALAGRGDLRQSRALADLRNRLLAALPPKAARAAETDADALLEAHGVALRPGPFVKADPALSDQLAAAFRGPFRMTFSYTGERRLVEPYGVLIGPRRYLVARQPDKGPQLRHYRLDRIAEAEVTDQWFARDPGFSLADHAARAFGAFQNEAEHGEVVWRFSAEAAERAAEWRFHPSQAATMLPDGRLEVRFVASGWLEMTWHLYCWGDAVEVVAPEGLKALVAESQRHFGVLP
jgi:predicted DNA-binding transcriptional regulator YafY